MDWQDDYQGFAGLFAAVAQGYHKSYPARTSIGLDFEYKKDARLGRVVKQVRQLPQAGTARPVTAFLVDDPLVYWIWCSFAPYGAGMVFGCGEPTVRHGGLLSVV